jgi:hypothetical protein
MKKFLVGFILFSMVFSVIPGAVAIDYDIIVGQNEKVGTLALNAVGDTLYFNYAINSPWELCEVHLTALNEVPEADKENIWFTNGYITKTGNPKVGQFEINEEFDPYLTEYSSSLNIGELGNSNLTIAAHALVCRQGDEIMDYGYEPTDYPWAINYSNYINGSPDSTDSWRYDPLLCLEESDSSNQGTKTFTSLGHGGSIELYFDGSICGDGDNSTPDLEIYEVTYNQNTNWVESIGIEAYYNGNYYLVGNATNNLGSTTGVTNMFINCIYDLPSGVCIEKIRINDTLSTHDYDIDAVKANYKCVPIYNCICESAWANDTCFGGETFPGNNWATYVIYPECD